MHAPPARSPVYRPPSLVYRLRMQHVRVYRELLDHCSEGLRFYLGMAEVVKKAAQEAHDFAFTRQVGRSVGRSDGNNKRLVDWLVGHSGGCATLKALSRWPSRGSW